MDTLYLSDDMLCCSASGCDTHACTSYVLNFPNGTTQVMRYCAYDAYAFEIASRNLAMKITRVAS